MLDYLGAAHASVVQWSMVTATSLVAAAFDLRSRRIPNYLTGALFVSGLASGMLNGGLTGLGSSIAGCLLLAAPFVVPWLFAGGGAGDAKLMGGIGAWLGLSCGTVVLVCVLASGIVLGLLWALGSGRIREVMWNVTSMSGGMLGWATGRQGTAQLAGSIPDHRRMLKMPYGLAICMGVSIAALGVYLAGGHQWHN